MTGPRLRKLLYRLYINWAITLLILFIPSLIRHAKGHAVEAAQLADQALQQEEIADVLAEEAENHTNRDWCSRKAGELERANEETVKAAALSGETPSNFRNADWCARHAQILKEHSEQTRMEAVRNERRAARYARWANALALVDILPFWSIGALTPWLLHLLVVAILRRRSPQAQGDHEGP